MATTSTLPIITFDPAQDTVEEKFYYGHRLVETEDDEGNYRVQYVPLAQDDFLTPQHGDHFVQGTLHVRDVNDLESIVHYALRERFDLTVFSDLKMEWPDPTWYSPAPDVSVVPNVNEPERPRGRFRIEEEGTQPTLVIEMVSPRYVRPDLFDKVFIYQRAGIDEYIIIDSGLREGRTAVDYIVGGYRLEGERYRPIQPDENGFVLSRVANLLFGPSGDHQKFHVLDAKTRTRILSDRERAEAERERAEAEHKRAEAEHEARVLAEQRVQYEAGARESAEAQVRELAAELARLRGEQPNS